jgi:secreted PhoX family phosphatase
MKSTQTHFLLGLGLLLGGHHAFAQTQPATNQAFQFNGTATSVVKVANFANPAGDFSIEAWASIGTGGAAEDDIVSTHENSGPRKGYFIEYAYAGGNAPGLRAGIAGSSGNFISAQYNGANWQPGQWHRVVMTFSVTSRAIRLYQDGVQVATATMAAGETPVYSTRPLAIGGSDSYPDNAFNGSIDEVRFWDRELTALEIETNTHLKGATTATGLRAYYPLDELGTANAVSNLASTGLTGTAGAAITAASVATSYAPIELAPITGLRYKGNWAGQNSSNNGGLTVASAYTTEPVFVLNGRTAATGLTAAGVPSSVQRRLQRVWRFEKSGQTALAANTLRFSLGDLGIVPGTTGAIYLLRSRGNSTYSLAVPTAGTEANGIVSFPVADTTKAYLTLGFAQTPQIDGPLVATGSVWKYLDNGTDQGTAWQANAFNDATWASGNAELGYGDSDEATTVSYGPSATNKFVTTYFRQNFNVSSLVGFTSVKLRLKRDDGAVVYINGVEVFRSNMPTGAVAYNTFASATVDGANESTFFEATLPASVLAAGANTIAVEIHQDRVASSDISFDLELLRDTSPTLVCPPMAATYLSNYTSVEPGAQLQGLKIPSTHTFQLLMQSGDAYANPADGVVKENNDFTAYVPIAGSSTNGYLSVNHEGSSTASSGVSMLNLNFNPATKLWNVTAKNPVNFTPVVGTYNNCSGGITPWNTVITCEENTPTAPTDSNNDGYLDFGWNVEMDPATHTVKDQNGDGTPDKLWKMGRFKHENVVVSADRRTVYEGADEGGSSYVYKYIATTAGNLATGSLYVLRLNGPLGTATSGIWIQVPNGTPTECNSVTATAGALGATNFSGVEDVEISPLDGRIYFTSKSNSRVYRFVDAPTAISGFEVFIGGQDYTINYGTGTATESWRDGNDNLTFDTEGNLYVLQDGGRNHIWMVKPCHTQANPAVELFAVTPTGSEPTGMTLSPDNKFMFVSLQHPSSTNTLATTDAAGQSVVFNKSSTLVIARKTNLGTTALAVKNAGNTLAKVEVYPNPTASELNVEFSAVKKEAATVQVFNTIGAKQMEQPAALIVGANHLKVPVSKLRPGMYVLVIKTAGSTTSSTFIKQ